MLDLDPNLRLDPSVVAAQDRVQIMDLHTENPVVSYKNQIFTCSWYDLLGSELIFSFPDECPDIPRLREHPDFDLITMSRVKLMGQKANLISASKEKAAPAQQSSTDATLPATNQGKFLQRLMEAKERKGETDTVRTIFPQKRIWGFDPASLSWNGPGTQTGEAESSNHPPLYGHRPTGRPLGSGYSATGPPQQKHDYPGPGHPDLSLNSYSGDTAITFESAYPAPQGTDQPYEYGAEQPTQPMYYDNEVTSGYAVPEGSVQSFGYGHVGAAHPIQHVGEGAANVLDNNRVAQSVAEQGHGYPDTEQLSRPLHFSKERYYVPPGGEEGDNGDVGTEQR